MGLLTFVDQIIVSSLVEVIVLVQLSQVYLGLLIYRGKIYLEFVGANFRYKIGARICISENDHSSFHIDIL